VDKIAQGRVWAGVDAQRIGLVDTLGGLKDASDAAAKLAEMGSEYDADYIESEMTLREELLMQLRSESLQMARMLGLIAPRSELDRALDPVLEQARSLARLNDPRGLYAYCWCREPRGSVERTGLSLSEPRSVERPRASQLLGAPAPRPAGIALRCPCCAQALGSHSMATRATHASHPRSRRSSRACGRLSSCVAGRGT